MIIELASAQIGQPLERLLVRPILPVLVGLTQLCHGIGRLGPDQRGSHQYGEEDQSRQTQGRTPVGSILSCLAPHLLQSNGQMKGVANLPPERRALLRFAAA